MASPALESFCCLLWGNETDDLNYTVNGSSVVAPYRAVIVTYNTLCIMSSSLSVCGTIYQLVPKQPSAHLLASSQRNSVIRQNNIICWLAIADLSASFGNSSMLPEYYCVLNFFFKQLMEWLGHFPEIPVLAAILCVAAWLIQISNNRIFLAQGAKSEKS